MPEFKMPESFKINDNMIEPPIEESDMESVEILQGPNIKPYPKTSPLTDKIERDKDIRYLSLDGTEIKIRFIDLFELKKSLNAIIAEI